MSDGRAVSDRNPFCRACGPSSPQRNIWPVAQKSSSFRVPRDPTRGDSPGRRPPNGVTGGVEAYARPYDPPGIPQRVSTIVDYRKRKNHRAGGSDAQHASGLRMSLAALATTTSSTLCPIASGQRPVKHRVQQHAAPLYRTHRASEFPMIQFVNLRSGHSKTDANATQIRIHCIAGPTACKVGLEFPTATLDHWRCVLLREHG